MTTLVFPFLKTSFIEIKLTEHTRQLLKVYIWFSRLFVCSPMQAAIATGGFRGLLSPRREALNPSQCPALVLPCVQGFLKRSPQGLPVNEAQISPSPASRASLTEAPCYRSHGPGRQCPSWISLSCSPSYCVSFPPTPVIFLNPLQCARCPSSDTGSLCVSAVIMCRL